MSGMTIDIWTAKDHLEMTKAKADRIQELYDKYRSITKVAQQPHICMSLSQIWRVLKRAGLTKPRGYRRRNCVDCGQPTNGKTRCPKHKRLRDAKMNLRAVHRYNKKLKSRQFRLDTQTNSDKIPD